MPRKFLHHPAVRRIIDVFAYPITWAGTHLFKYYRNSDGLKMPLTKRLLHRKGVFPIINRYDEPLFQQAELRHSLDKERALQWINWNTAEQLSILDKFDFNSELTKLNFDFNNNVFEQADAAYLYNMIRTYKPERIIEAGGGYSSLIAQLAIIENKNQDQSYRCTHTCIEPYPSPVLEKSGAEIIKDKIENMDPAFFKQLRENDILFIDTSHMIRPQGDVLFIYLQVLPSINSGVWVHIHDIFTPRDYPASWLIENNRFWNEQYLLEAFLAGNKDYRITGALNYLKHNFNNQLMAKCPPADTPAHEPGSFWIKKN